MALEETGVVLSHFCYVIYSYVRLILVVLYSSAFWQPLAPLAATLETPMHRIRLGDPPTCQPRLVTSNRFSRSSYLSWMS